MPFIATILRLLLQLGGGSIGQGLAERLLGKQALKLGARAGVGAAKLLGRSPTGKIAGTVQRTISGAPGLAGFLGGADIAGRLLGGPDADQAAQAQSTSPRHMAAQDRQLSAIEQEAQLRRTLDELGIDFDDLQDGISGGGLI